MFLYWNPEIIHESFTLLALCIAARATGPGKHSELSGVPWKLTIMYYNIHFSVIFRFHIGKFFPEQHSPPELQLCRTLSSKWPPRQASVDGKIINLPFFFQLLHFSYQHFCMWLTKKSMRCQHWSIKPYCATISTYGAGHGGAAVLLRGFAISW